MRGLASSGPLVYPDTSAPEEDVMHSRLVAHLVGGPRKGEIVSVDSRQAVVASEVFDHDKVKENGDGTQSPVQLGRYVKDEATVRPVEEDDILIPHPNSTPERHVESMARFDNMDARPLEQAVDFIYTED